MRIGVDLGGTKIEARALGSDGAELKTVRVATPSGDYSAIVAVVRDLVVGIEDELGRADSVGIGTPGAIDPVTGLMKNSNSTALNGEPLDLDLASSLGREIRMANDADCLAVSEAHDGAGAGADPVFAAILGTGVGGGLVANGKLVRGPNRIAGEWGHNGLPWLKPDEATGPECYCGLVGCIETFLSGPALEREHRSRTGVALGGAAIATAAAGGDGDAIATMDLFHDRLARALANVINILDPEVVVLGGGVSNIPSLYTSVPQIWDKYVFSSQVLTRLERSVHGDSSGVRGAAWLWDA